jgi:hypothetical protein
MSSTLHVQRVVEFGSRRLLHNLTDMCRKPSAGLGLCVAMVPELYHHPLILSPLSLYYCPCLYTIALVLILLPLSSSSTSSISIKY